ncbi:MAG: GNAT family N-acetyltransferase [Myxococcota bacterium]|nr:GNAT family N-acetyltransferase [Myxococcota bacterium]
MPRQAPTTRPMDPRDVPRLAEMIRSVETFSPEEIACALELVDLAAQPGNADYRVLVAEAPGDGGIAGYACYGPTPMTRRTFDLYWIATRPAARGSGTGRALHDAVVAAVGRAGGRTLRVETSARDAYGASRRFYERAGYGQVGRIDDFYDEGDHLVILSLAIDGAA